MTRFVVAAGRVFLFNNIKFNFELTSEFVCIETFGLPLRSYGVFVGGGAGAIGWNNKFQTQGGDTALMWAAQSGHADCVRALVEAGANKYAKNKVRE